MGQHLKEMVQSVQGKLEVQNLRKQKIEEAIKKRQEGQKQGASHAQDAPREEAKVMMMEA